MFEAPNEYAVQSYAEIGINDCMADPGTYGADAAPANHLFLCSGDKLTAVRYRCFLGVFCSPIAWADFRVTSIRRATEPGRSVSVVSLMDNFVFGGDVAQILPVQLRLSMNCARGAGLGTVCEQDNPLGSTNSIATWSSSTIGTPFTFTAPAGDTFGDDGLS